MIRKRTVKLTRFELEMMDALWDLGSGSIREIHDALDDRQRPAYTTVQTIIRRLEEKRNQCPRAELHDSVLLGPNYLAITSTQPPSKSPPDCSPSRLTLRSRDFNL